MSFDDVPPDEMGIDPHAADDALERMLFGAPVSDEWRDVASFVQELQEAVPPADLASEDLHVAAMVETDDGLLTAVCTHLSFVPWWNGHQLRSLVRSLAPAERPLVLMGDLNMGVRRAVAASGMTPAAAHPTFPWDLPREQLDHILLDGALTATDTAAPRLPLSDHRALVADLSR